MDKNFLIIALVGIVALGAVAYFAFIVNQPSREKSVADTTSQNTQQKKELPQATELKIEDIKVGDGPEVKSGDTVKIHYTGTLTDGTKFDSSLDRGTPFVTKIGVGQVIEGWDKGVVGMKVGGVRKLTIPPSMGYGDQQAGEIPPNSTLIFQVELLGIEQ